MSVWRDLVTENPMLFEIRRHWRRGFAPSGGRGLGIAILILCGILYFCILVIAGTQRRVELAIFGSFAVGLQLLVVPATMQSAIAGERERRSWEMLIVAPISRAQIVVGKYLGGAGAAVGIALALLLPMLVQMRLTLAGQTWFDRREGLPELVRVEAVVVTFGLMLAALALYVSACSKKSITALAGTYCVLILGLAVEPVIALMMVQNVETGKAWFVLHPFMVLQAGEFRDSHTVLNGTLQCFTYLGIAAVLLWAAARHLRVADLAGGGRVKEAA